MKIAVLKGGNSPEREVSLQTGNAVETVLNTLEHDVIGLECDDDFKSLIPSLLNSDFVFNALHGGMGENGTIQGLLECINRPYSGSGVMASSLCMNKYLSKSVVNNLDIKTPNWIRITPSSPLPDLTQFPVIVKPNSLGSTLGLSLVKRPENLKNAVEIALDYDDVVLIENYVKGREIVVSIVGNKTLPLIEICPSHELYDFECKYSKGMSSYHCNPEISHSTDEKIKFLGKKIYDNFGCSNYGRIDFLLDEHDDPWFLEVNTLPGMTDTSLVPMAAKEYGWSFSHLIEKIIKEAMRK